MLKNALVPFVTALLCLTAWAQDPGPFCEADWDAQRCAAHLHATTPPPERSDAFLHPDYHSDTDPDPRPIEDVCEELGFTPKQCSLYRKTGCQYNIGVGRPCRNVYSRDREDVEAFFSPGVMIQGDVVTYLNARQREAVIDDFLKVNRKGCLYFLRNVLDKKYGVSDPEWKEHRKTVCARKH